MHVALCAQESCKSRNEPNGDKEGTLSLDMFDVVSLSVTTVRLVNNRLATGAFAKARKPERRLKVFGTYSITIYVYYRGLYVYI